MAIHNEVELETVKTIIDLMQKKPFYGFIIQQFEKVYIPEGEKTVETAAVGRGRGEKTLKLYINEGYFKELTKDKAKGKAYVNSMIEHEILHVVMNHLLINFADHVRGNVACDIVVNQYVDPVHENWITKEKYELPEGKSCYWYYEELKKNKKYQNDLKNGAFGEEGIYSYLKDSHSKWDGLEGDKQVEGMVKDMMRKAKESCNNSYGDIHSDIKTFLDDFLKTEKPKISWSRVLRLFVASSSESNLAYTIQKISKRYETRPGTKLEDQLSLAVTIDTSGSISDEDLMEFFTEIRSIWKNGALVTLIEADSEICRTYQFKGKFDGSVTGRGGTDLEPALKWVDEQKKFDAHIYFTDFYAPNITKKYKTPILWVLTHETNEEDCPYKWGRKVNIRDGRPI